MKDKIRVAVYGSLKSGFGLHGTLKRWESKLLGTDRLSYYMMFDLNAFPAVIPSVNMADAAAVEIYEVTPECLDVLDKIEGVSSFHYERVKVETRLGDAWMYQYHPESTANRLQSLHGSRVVDSGNWTQPPVSMLWTEGAILSSMDATYRARVEACRRGERPQSNIIPFRVGGEAVLKNTPVTPPPAPKETQFDLPIIYVEDAPHADVSDSAI